MRKPAVRSTVFGFPHFVAPSICPRLIAGGSGVQPALQDQHRCQAVDDFASALDRHFGIPQHAIGFG